MWNDIETAESTALITRVDDTHAFTSVNMVDGFYDRRNGDAEKGFPPFAENRFFSFLRCVIPIINFDNVH